MKRQLSALLAAGMLLAGLTGCGSQAVSEDGVSVQTVASILGYDLSGNNRYSGVVESQTTQKIQKDDEKQVSEIMVQVGDTVKKGDVLFSYDEESIRLSVETAQLELEQMQNNIDNYQTQIDELTKEKKKASSSEKLSYSIQIQEAQLSLSEEQYNQKKKQAELKNLQEDLENVNITAEVDGIVQSIQDGSSTSYDYGGTDNSFMTILETGVYQVKGTASEMSIYNLYEGEPVTVRSRVDDTQIWSGQISKINTDSVEEDNSDNYYGESTGESASKYSFNVTLDSSDGLMMGQHVYIEEGAVAEGEGVQLYSYYVVQEDDGSAYVWAADKDNKLEKRTVTLGDYDEMMDTYQILDGLTLEDAIAYPDETLEVGAAVSLFDPSAFEEIDDGGDYADVGDFGDGSFYDEGGDYMEGEEDYAGEDGGFFDDAAAVPEGA